MEHEVEIRLKSLERRMDAVESRVDVATLAPPSVQVLKRPPGPAPDTTSETEPGRLTPPVREPAAAFEAPPLLAADPVAEDEAVPPEPEGEPVPAPTPRAPVDRVPFDWERVLGMAVLGRIGVAAVLMAAGYFAQLAYRHMNDSAKVFVLYGLSVALLGVGALIRRRVPKMYVGLLWGAGVAVAYMAGVAGHITYGLFSGPVTFVLLVLACLLGQLLARFLRNETFAVVTLAGAFAVPMLLDVRPDATQFLLYALILYAWSAWCGHAWKWRVAHAVGVLGLVALGGISLVLHGDATFATWGRVQIYLLALVAPLIVRSWMRRPVSFEPAQLAGLFVSVVSAAIALGYRPFGFGFAAGVLWLAVAAAVALRYRTSELVPPIAGWAGFLLVLSGLAIAGAPPAGWDRALWASRAPALVLAAMAGVLLASRRLLRVGEGAAVTAAAFATLALFGTVRNTSELMWMGWAPLLANAALTAFSRHVVARTAGLVLGAGLLLLTGGYLAGEENAWHTAGPALAAFWTMAWLLYGPTRHAGFRATAQLLWVPTVVLWIALAFEGPAQVATGFDPGTLTGLVIVACAALCAHRFGGFARERFAGLAVVVAALVGYREVIRIPASLSAEPAGLYWIVGYFLTFGLSLAAGSRRHWASGRAWASGALIVAATYSLGHGSSVETAAVAFGVLALSWMLKPSDDVARIVTALAGGLSVVAWGATAWHTTFASDAPVLWNATFRSGLPILAALTLAATRSPARPRDAERIPVALFLTAFAYVLGLHETLLLASGWDHNWPRIAVSLYSIVFAAGLLAVGFVRHLRGLRLLALGMFFAIVAKIGVYDLASSPLPLRILVTGVLGLVLLGAAYAYARRDAERRQHA